MRTIHWCKEQVAARGLKENRFLNTFLILGVRPTKLNGKIAGRCSELQQNKNNLA